MLSMLIIAFESLAVATVLPQVAEHLNGLKLYGWSFSAFFMGFMVSTVALGGLADRIGPARPYLLSALCFGLGLTIAGLAPTMAVFILGRAVQGFGGGGVVAVAYLAINKGFPDELRARVLALMSSAWVLPGLIGPALASALAALLSWRGVFLGLLPLLGLAALLTLPALRRMPASGTPVDRSRLIAVTLAALGVALGLAALGQHRLLPGLLLGVLGTALALPALGRLYGRNAYRVPSPLEAGFAVRLCLTFGFFGAEALLPLSLQRLRGLGLLESGLALTAAALVWSLCSFLHSRLDERTAGRYRSQVVRAGSLVIALSLLLSGWLLHSTLPVWTVGLAWALGGAGMGFAFQAHTLVVLKQAPEGQEGQVSGNLQLADMLGSALGAGLGGALVGLLGVSSGSGWYLSAGTLAVMGAVLVAGKLRRTP
ncbi:MFS transporter [Deinococcus sp. KNUC1210]|uniref:MFS transporter n=1 Tax=Deinococcus sp. KNUC1210 TaxID=2917691 RepID=UPI001EF02BFE|nr:MFS transporter [Deinococcus sp. KNUC1210]ULH14448.1 MFS transporter [Deinococcus sp. KNUC1210]